MQSYKTSQVGGRASQVRGIACIFKVRKRIFQPQISVPIDKPYKWNIAGLLEQKIINHMSKVDIAHQNNYDIDQPDTFDYSVVVSPSYRRWRHPSRKVNS